MEDIVNFHVGNIYTVNKKNTAKARGQPKPLKPGTYRETGGVKFSKTRNRNLPGSPKT